MFSGVTPGKKPPGLLIENLSGLNFKKTGSVLFLYSLCAKAFKTASLIEYSSNDQISFSKNPCLKGTLVFLEFTASHISL